MPENDKNDQKPQPGKKTHMEHHASDESKVLPDAAQVDGEAGKP